MADKFAEALKSLALLLFSFALSGCASVAPSIDPGSQPTAEGLYEVAGIDATQAYAHPEARLNQYTGILIRAIQVDFRAGGETSWTSGGRRTSGPYAVSEELAAEYRTIAQLEIRDEFDKSRRFTLVDEPGDDVLLITIVLDDVISNVPPAHIGRSSAYLGVLGEARLILEVRDSSSGAVLARVVDRHEATPVATQTSINPAGTSNADIERMFGMFGRQMRRQLEGLADIAE